MTTQFPQSISIKNLDDLDLSNQLQDQEQNQKLDQNQDQDQDQDQDQNSELITSQADSQPQLEHQQYQQASNELLQQLHPSYLEFIKQKHLNLAAIRDYTQAEGPGIRTAIWTQGCRKTCKGCCNPDMLKTTPNQIISVYELLQRVAYNKVAYNIEGITLMGGEPFIQAVGLASFAQGCRMLGLSVMIFSGYLLEELDAVDETGQAVFPGGKELLQFTDLLCDGEYIRELQEEVRNWVGSTNQRFHYLTNFYDSSIETMPQVTTNELRFYLDHVEVNGLPIKIQNARPERKAS